MLFLIVAMSAWTVRAAAAQHSETRDEVFRALGVDKVKPTTSCSSTRRSPCDKGTCTGRWSRSCGRFSESCRRQTTCR